MTTQSWSRLVRFQAPDGTEKYGDLCVTDEHDLSRKLHANQLQAVELHASAGPFAPFTRGQTVPVQKLLPVLQRCDVPIIRCIGLNYKKHIEEGGRTPPPHPSVFIKPSTCLAGFDEDIPIPAIAQDGTLDYEGELAIVIGKQGTNIPKDKALEYVAGYCSSNDVSNRAWQKDPSKAGLVPQWCFSKGFDKFCPLGPMIVSPQVVQDASGLQIQTFVNGEERQNSPTGDLLFDVPHLVSFCSQGTTLEPGTVILTGTPSGVAMGMKNPKYLTDGDVVEVRISQLGSVKNTMVFQK